MKYILYVLIGVLVLVTSCATVQAQRSDTAEQNSSGKNLDQQIDRLADQLINDVGIHKTSKIAVIEFVDLDGKVSQFGKYIAEELTTRLFRTGKFQIVERQLLNKLMEEQKLSALGLTDQKTAKEFGLILGVDAITTGTISALNTSIKINARLIGAETGSVFAAASVTVARNKEIELLLEQGPSANAVNDGFEIMADLDWQNTIPVKAGQVVTVKASGAWNHGEPGFGNYGPRGCDKMDAGVILPGEHVGTLIGRINNRDPFAVSEEKTFTADVDGFLQLCMNDWGFKGNSGSMKVQIVVK